jgi:hypothetical protein
MSDCTCQKCNGFQDDVRVICPTCRRDITDSPSYVNAEHLMGLCEPGKLHHVVHLSVFCEDGKHEACGRAAFPWKNLSWNTQGVQVCPCECHKDQVGKMVREAWVDWAKTHPSPKPSWLLPYEKLDESDKEADRRIGTHLLQKFIGWLTRG